MKKEKIKEKVLSYIMPRVKKWVEKEENVGLKLRIYQAIELSIHLTAKEILKEIGKEVKKPIKISFTKPSPFTYPIWFLKLKKEWLE
ncbi:hypothetical protein DRO54_11795 [Candidatus Bathyarchaeota archaeon]|nr:MAG: hypothetical protein DRO54_11795 [Candidatus Bathyarchaeota archaeon]